MDDDIPTTMTAVLLTGHGGLDRLEVHHDVPVPRPGPDQVLIRVAAAGVNNTDVNTRTGWYASSVTGGSGQDEVADGEVGGWAGEPLAFPLIQGADVCGHVVGVGPGVDAARIGQRVVVATMQRAPAGDRPFTTVTLGSELDGAFAQYMVAHTAETHAVHSSWSDVELASVPCAWSTAENLLQRAGVTATDRVLVTGASGGVGTGVVQLARVRGAQVIGVCSATKADAVRGLGAQQVVHRGVDPVAALGSGSVDVVVDLVGGPTWPRLLEVLRNGGRYVTAGAIAGPVVELDLRTLYLKDLTLLGATYQPPGVMEALVRHVEADAVRPLVHATYPLADIARAQEDFMAKDHVGKLVLIPPGGPSTP